MAKFGNLNNQRKTPDIFANDNEKQNQLTKKYQAEPGIIPGQRPAPWLGRHILAVLTFSSIGLLVTMLIYTVLNSN